MAADKPVINPFRAPGISVIKLPAAHTRDIIIGSLARICYPVPLFPSFRQSGRDPPFLVPPPPPPLGGLSASVVRASALIMRGFRRSRFHSFLRLRHREMIIGTWPMWSVHTRNETTSRMVSSRGARRETCRGGGPRGRMESTARGGENGGQGDPRASTRVIRQPRRCRRCRRAPTCTMRLVLSHTQGVSRPHILLRRGGPQKEREKERGERFARRPPSERETRLTRGL